jgi:Protein of unknown function (DUF2721)
MDITINTPALLFPAISLIMLAYTNRFLALASLVRNLHDKYKAEQHNNVIHSQIKSLRFRLRLIKNMQAFGVLSFLLCIVCMYLSYIENTIWANITFAMALLAFATSLIISLWEIWKSNKALELALSDMEGLEDPSIVDYIKKKLEGE